MAVAVELRLASHLQNRERMTSPMSLAVKVALWTSSVGLAVLVARRIFARRAEEIDVGSVSQDWLAQQRWPPSDPFTV